MKQLLFMWATIAMLTTNAQTGYRQLQVSGGLSAFNSRIFSIQLESAGTHKIHAGMMFQALWYSPNKNLHFPIHDSRLFESVGLYLKKDIYTAKNFCATVYLGGAIGTDTHNIILYPMGGLEQGWFIRPKTQLFISENLLYLRNIDLANNLQPILQMGIKCLL
jgi:hypothetical protein